jgi:cellulose synthase/poly-beta-1,6-N-acetylglucosamine synthase-like glycosyltransferase
VESVLQRTKKSVDAFSIFFRSITLIFSAILSAAILAHRVASAFEVLGLVVFAIIFLLS